MIKLSLASAATALLAAAPAIAGTTVFTSEAEFRAAAAGAALSLESFEQARGTGTSLDFGGDVSFACRNCAPALSTRYATDGRLSLGVNTGVAEPMEFSFVDAINAVSFDLSDFGSLAPADLMVSVGGQDISLLRNFSGTTGNRLFFGFISGTAFSGFRLTGGNSGDTAYYDRMSFGANAVAGAVPEPSVWAMLIAGFGVVGGLMRRTPRRRHVAFAA